MLAMEQYDGVVETLWEVIEIDPYNYTANLRLAYTLRLREKYDEAEEIASKMLTLYPTDVSFMTEYALDEYAKGNKDAAAETMWNVLVLDPDNKTANEYFNEK